MPQLKEELYCIVYHIHYYIVLTIMFITIYHVHIHIHILLYSHDPTWQSNVKRRLLVQLVLMLDKGLSQNMYLIIL